MAALPTGLSLSTGSDAWISIRPESIEKLDGTGPDGFNRLSGKVTDTVYAGSMIKLHLGLPSGERLVLYHPSDRGSVSVGDDARVGWPRERGVLLVE